MQENGTIWSCLLKKLKLQNCNKTDNEGQQLTKKRLMDTSE